MPSKYQDSRANLYPLIHPASVAVFGVSRRRKNVGAQLLENYQKLISDHSKVFAATTGEPVGDQQSLSQM